MTSETLRPSAHETGRDVHAERRIIAIAGATFLLYLATRIAEQLIVRNGIVLPGSILDPAHAADRSMAVWQMGLYFAVTALLFVLFGRVLSMAERGELGRGRARLWALAFPVALNFMLLPWVPRLSEDVFSYLAHGALGAYPGHNPFLEPAEAARHTALGPMLAVYGWNANPGITPYGIVWTRLEVAFVGWCHGDLLFALYMVKSVVVAASLGSALLIWRILGRISPSIQLSATLAYLWNPLILIEFAGEGHNDALMLFLSLAALAACVAARPTLSLVAQLLGVLSKYISLLFLPAQLMYLWRTRVGVGRLIVACLAAAVVTAAIALWLYAPLWVGLHSFDGMVKRALPVSSASLFGGIDWVLRRSPLSAISGPLTTALVTLPLLAIVAWTSLRVRDAADLARSFAWIALAYVLVASPDFWPWYACMPVALIIVGDYRRLWWLGMLMSIAARMLAPLELLRDRGFLPLQISKGLLTGLGSLLPLLAVLWWARRERQRSAVQPAV